jgi:hypothetical protein
VHCRFFSIPPFNEHTNAKVANWASGWQQIILIAYTLPYACFLDGWLRVSGAFAYTGMQLAKQVQGSCQRQRFEAVHGCVELGQGQRLLSADDHLQLCAHL